MGDLVGVAAIVVSVVLFTRQHGIQKQLAAIEDERRAEEVGARKQAEVTAGFEKYVNSLGKMHYKFVIQNLGPAPARRVIILFEQPAPAARLPRVVTHGYKSPIPQLDPGQEYSYPAWITQGVARSVDVRLTWEDEEGPKKKILALTWL